MARTRTGFRAAFSWSNVLRERRAVAKAILRKIKRDILRRVKKAKQNPTTAPPGKVVYHQSKHFIFNPKRAVRVAAYLGAAREQDQEFIL